MLKQSKRKALPWVSGQVLLAGLCMGVAALAWAQQGGGGVERGTSAAAMDRDIQIDKMPPPSYPRSAFENNQTGVVTLRVEVDAQGQLTHARVLSATNPGVFDAVSLAAARSWTYRPALKNGVPVAAAAKVPITFAMDEDDAGGGRR